MYDHFKFCLLGDANSYPFDDRYSEVMSAGVNEQPSVLEPSPVRNIHSGHCAVCTVIHLVKRLKTYARVSCERTFVDHKRKAVIGQCLEMPKKEEVECRESRAQGAE